MKVPTISALFTALALAGVISASPIAQENVKRQATIFDVTVGTPSGGNVYIPNAISGAQVGDVVNFTLASGAGLHSLTQAVSQSEPCTPVTGGVNHTFDPSIPSSTNFQQTVEFTAPFFAFCEVPGHCEDGMVFSVNA